MAYLIIFDDLIHHQIFWTNRRCTYLVRLWIAQKLQFLSQVPM